MSVTPRAWRGWLPIAVLLVVLDQLTKQWAVTSLADRDVDLFWTLRFNLHFNTGMAFGTGVGMGPIIGVLAMVIVVGLAWAMRAQTDRFSTIAVGLIIGGAVGNLIDRIFRGDGLLDGAVIDFIDLQWFPIFNVADMGITLGGLGLVWATSRTQPPTDSPSPVSGRPPESETLVDDENEPSKHAD